jgi:carboxylate-amine ligase
VFRSFPRTGIPDQFSSWSEYEEYLTLLVDLHCIDNGKKVWWDLRPHPAFGTLEFRICDVPTSPRATIALAAVVQAIVVKLYRLRRANLGFRIYSSALIEENKWRAARWGIDGRLIDFGARKEVPMPELMKELIAFVDDVVDELGSRREVEYIETIVNEGTSADRQLKVFRDTNSLPDVVRWIVDETRERLERAAKAYHV